METWTFNDSTTWIVPKTGIYLVEVWGAQGGNVSTTTGSSSSTRQGNPGNYTLSEMTLERGSQIPIIIGERGGSRGSHTNTRCVQSDRRDHPPSNSYGASGGYPDGGRGGDGSYSTDFTSGTTGSTVYLFSQGGSGGGGSSKFGNLQARGGDGVRGNSCRSQYDESDKQGGNGGTGGGSGGVAQTDYLGKGRVIVTQLSVIPRIFVNINGNWRAMDSNSKVNINNSWKPIKGVWANINGTWRNT